MGLRARSEAALHPGRASQWRTLTSRVSTACFANECSNEHWFVSLAHAREVIEARRQDYNDVRPHSALDTPAEFARAARTKLRSPVAPFDPVTLLVGVLFKNADPSTNRFYQLPLVESLLDHVPGTAWSRTP